MTGTVSVVTRGVHAAFACVADLVPDLSGTAGLASPPAAHRAGRMLLAELLAVTAGARLAGARVQADRRGRPYLPAHPGVGVSISHSGAYVAAAVAQGGRVGVDIEVPVPVGRGLCARCCADPVLATLDRLPAPKKWQEFARIWTVQEACVKCAGLGLAGAPWRIPVEVGQRHGSWHDMTWRTLPDQHAALVSCAFELEGDR